MMKKILPRLNARQVVLAVWTAGIVVFALAIDRYVFPAYQTMQAAVASLKRHSIEYSTLSGNLALRDSVNEQFEGLGNNARQTETSEITLSKFLQHLERLARYPSMRIVNIKPLTVGHEQTHKVYRANMSIGGKLQDILQFVSDVTDMPATGLESFSLRGVQGASMVECSLTICTIRVALADGDSKRPRERTLVANGGSGSVE